MLEGLEISIIKYKELNKDFLIIGSDFNSIRKIKTLEKIKSQHQVTDFFELKSNTINEIYESHLCYDLTHSLNGYLSDGEIVNKIYSTYFENDKSNKVINFKLNVKN